jgi:hypothetical protein
MNKKYLLNKDGSFTIKDYNRAHPFSNFLPGIAGEWGVPLWVFYVNRGQGLVSFGIKDKDHAIAEFFPANKAYSFAPRFGFRTLIKTKAVHFYEPFQIESSPAAQEMVVRSDSLEIKETNPRLGLDFGVNYFTLPNTTVGGLVRAVTIKNCSKKKINLEVLDGLSRPIPFGSINPFLKQIGRTLEAWMHSSIKDNLALFRLIVAPNDVSHTKYIEGTNFNYSFYSDKGKKISPFIIVDPVAIFGQDTSFSVPVNFLNKSFKTPLPQITVGRTPCSFSHFKWDLEPGQEKTFYSIFGAAFKADMVKKFVRSLDEGFVKEKEDENKRVVAEVKNNALCSSGLSNFNHYIQTTYLDNVLRGGFPYCAKEDIKEEENGKNIYYIFSRKHGDLERDYNHFQLLPSYFSEGEANYRDINQNRRMDLFFEPLLKGKNIRYFLNFIKIDGYNPLVIKGEKLYLNRLEARTILQEFGIKDQRLLHLMVRGFYLGEFFQLMEEEGIKLKRKKDLVACLLERSQRDPQAAHGEGYWIDHWHYNLDLIENYLYFYPDKVKELFSDREFFFWDDEHRIKPRARRYQLHSGRVQQGEGIETVKEKRTVLKNKDRFANFLRTSKGKIYETNLIAKLLSLILNKAATLDPDGIGIEMEADKPGWCDSLNGLPALFGSSLCETFELKRTALTLISAIKVLKKQGIRDVLVAQELCQFLDKLHGLLRSYLSSRSSKRDYLWWDKANSLKEDFREKTFFRLSGQEKNVSFDKLEKFLNDLITKLNIGINRARDRKSKLYATYFTYEVKDYSLEGKAILVREFRGKPLPLFLEGMVHALRVQKDKKLIAAVKRSKLFDQKLKMYRLNESLKNESLEIGRSRVFVPGWLENESIWLHMEYKYLLELLKNGLYDEFFTDLYNCGVCFFDPQKYGRSTLENSSFIVSSAYPDKDLWGKGFVARLSGATAELLNIWILLCLGREPFFVDRSGLCLRFAPILRKEFFTTANTTVSFRGKKVTLPANTFTFKLFSHILVTYHNPKRKDTFGRGLGVEKIVITVEGKKITYLSNIIRPPFSLAIRGRRIERIDVYLE